MQSITSLPTRAKEQLYQNSSVCVSFCVATLFSLALFAVAGLGGDTIFNLSRHWQRIGPRCHRCVSVCVSSGSCFEFSLAPHCVCLELRARPPALIMSFIHIINRINISSTVVFQGTQGTILAAHGSSDQFIDFWISYLYIYVQTFIIG